MVYSPRSTPPSEPAVEGLNCRFNRLVMRLREPVCAAVHQPERWRRIQGVSLINPLGIHLSVSGWHSLPVVGSRKRITDNSGNEWPLRHDSQRCPRYGYLGHLPAHRGTLLPYTPPYTAVPPYTVANPPYTAVPPYTVAHLPYTCTSATHRCSN